MPVRASKSIDLRVLAATDPVAAEIGRQLNSTRGVNRDGDPLTLRRDEFALNPPLRPVLQRLDQAFFGAAVSPVPFVEPAVLRASAFSPVARGGIAMPGVLFVSASGRQTSFVGRGDTGELLRGTAQGSGPFSPPTRERIIATGVTGATIRGKDYLYTVEPDGKGNGSLRRRQVLPNGLGRVEQIKVSPPIPFMHWPQLTSLADGRVVLATVVPGQKPFLAISDDGGRNFKVTTSPAHSPVDSMTLAHVAGFRDGALVVTTQVGDSTGQVQAFVRTSADGITFSAPVKVTTTSSNVHDAFPVPRADGDVDLYYLKASGDGFAAFRRSFARQGQLGPEQQLTGSDLGSVEKPQARRLPDGSVRLILAKRNRADDFDVLSAVLPGDAPKPGR